MCGIVAAISKQDETVNDWVINTFQEQTSRGLQGFGAVFFDKEKHIIKRATEITQALITLNLNPSNGILFHHRFPTSSKNKINQTHPFLVTHPLFKSSYLIVHNGHVSNDDELKKIHEGLGFAYTSNEKTEDAKYVYNSFNDSEALAIELARYMEGETKEILSQGSAAFVGLRIGKKTGKVLEMFFGRNTNPLKMKLNKSGIFLSSEGEGQDIARDTLYQFKMNNFALETTPLIIPSYVAPAAPEPTYKKSNWYNSFHQSELGFKDKAASVPVNVMTNEEMMEMQDEPNELFEVADDIQALIDAFYTEAETGLYQTHVQMNDLIGGTIKDLRIQLQRYCQKAKTERLITPVDSSVDSGPKSHIYAD